MQPNNEDVPENNMGATPPPVTPIPEPPTSQDSMATEPAAPMVDGFSQPQSDPQPAEPAVSTEPIPPQPVATFQPPVADEQPQPIQTAPAAAEQPKPSGFFGKLMSMFGKKS